MRLLSETIVRRLVAFTIGLTWSLPFHAHALSPDQPQPWDACLEHEAAQLDIPPALFRALVYTESRNHPWAIAWTDHQGVRHSVFPQSKDHAYRVLTQLQRRQHTLDLGLGQLNSRNWTAITERLNISPHQLLEPCHNLTAASMILREQLAKHARTWRSLAGYNGSVGSPTYILRVHANLCRHTPHFCSDSPRESDPLPTVHDPIPPIALSLPVVQIAPSAVSADLDTGPSQIHEDLSTETPQKETAMTWFDTMTLALPNAHTILGLCLSLLIPFAIVIAMVVVICYGLLVMLWALGLVKEGVRSLFTGRPAFPIPLPAFLHATPQPHILNRRL